MAKEASKMEEASLGERAESNAPGCDDATIRMKKDQVSYSTETAEEARVDLMPANSSTANAATTDVNIDVTLKRTEAETKNDNEKNPEEEIDTPQQEEEIIQEDDDDDDFGDFCVMGASTGASSLFLSEPQHEEPLVTGPSPSPSDVFADGSSSQAEKPPQPEANILPEFSKLKSEADAAAADPQEAAASVDANNSINNTRVNTNDDKAVPISKSTGKPSSGFLDGVRKAGVAVAGGTLTAVGLVMIPLPTPMGCVVAGSGMALLGTEFEAANRVMERVQVSAENARDKLLDNVESTILDEEEANVKEDISVTTSTRTVVKTTKQNEGNDTDESAKNNPQHDTCPNASYDKNDADSEIVISVNADGYFDKESSAIPKPTSSSQATASNTSTSGWRSSWRKKIQLETRGFLATTVLPALQKTKQFGASANNDAGDDNKEGGVAKSE